MTGQMCVRRYGNRISGQPAIIFIHGAAQTGTHFEVTPDGRPGLAVLQAAAGWECYVVDQPGVGRSRYHADDIGDLSHYTVEAMESFFTAPSPESTPWAALHTQWPGSGKRGDPIFDAFYASQVGHIVNYKVAEKLFRAAAKALFQRTGPAFLVTHSQSGPMGWHAADECPDQVCGIVALEPHGPPYLYPNSPPFSTRPELLGKVIHPFGITTLPLHYDPPLPPDAQVLPFTTEEHCVLPGSSLVETEKLPRDRPRQLSPARRLQNLAHVPIVVTTAEASYHKAVDALTVEFLRDAGVPTEHIYLADRGIYGNGHLMALEKNNDEIQRLIDDWLRGQISTVLQADQNCAERMTEVRK